MYEPNLGDWPVFCRSLRWKYCLVNGITKRFFLDAGSMLDASTGIHYALFLVLHCLHCCFDIAVVTVNLLLKVFFTFCQLLKRFFHTAHFLLPLKPLSMFASHVVSNGIEDALETIISCDLAFLLQLKKCRDCMGFNCSKVQPDVNCLGNERIIKRTRVTHERISSRRYAESVTPADGCRLGTRACSFSASACNISSHICSSSSFTGRMSDSNRSCAGCTLKIARTLRLAWTQSVFSSACGSRAVNLLNYFWTLTFDKTHHEHGQIDSSTQG